MPDSPDITALLTEWVNGNRQALDQLTPHVYSELRRLAAGYLKRERPNHTLEPTGLINEAYLRLLDLRDAPAVKNRCHFFAIAAHLMRQILVDHARRHRAGKRAGGMAPIEETMSVPGGRSAKLLALDDSLKSLEKIDSRKCRVIELHYFGGLALKDIAEALSVSTKTVSRDITLAEAWLYHEIRNR